MLEVADVEDGQAEVYETVVTGALGQLQLAGFADGDLVGDAEAGVEDAEGGRPTGGEGEQLEGGVEERSEVGKEG